MDNLQVSALYTVRGPFRRKRAAIGAQVARHGLIAVTCGASYKERRRVGAGSA
jgi:hypothetical protein